MEEKKCKICGATENERIIKWVTAIGGYLCSKHKAQYYRYGKITDTTKRTTTDKNEIRILDDHAEIILRNSKQEITGIALIDLDDVEKCKNIKWTINIDGYIRGGSEKIRLHRLILNYDGDLDVDHINRNIFDNRKANLRIVPRMINAQNNGAIGIHYIKKSDKWRVQIERYGNYYNVGTFYSMEDAIKARQEKIKEIDEEREKLISEYATRKGMPEKGVGPTSHGKWKADFCADGKKYHVGTFKTKEEAIQARKYALDEYFRKKTSA